MWPFLATGSASADGSSASAHRDLDGGQKRARPPWVPIERHAGRTLIERRGLVQFGIGSLATLAGCAGGLDSRTNEPSSTRGREVRLIAHRGCAGQYPENTILAAERSAPQVDMIEFDVQRCGSGELVVFHDDELDRLTDASGPVSATDWAELKDLTILDSEETIPRLSDVLEAVPSDTAVNIELKHDGMAEEVLSAAREWDNEVLFSAFWPDALEEIRERDGDAALAVLVSENPERGLSFATDIDAVAVNPGVDTVLETDFVERAHEKGLEVNTWTVDDRETANRVIDAGVDGLFVDRCDLLDA